MAKRPTANPAIDELPPAMDYPQHERTYRGFLMFMQYTAIGLALLLVSLYFFVIAANPVLGTLFMIAIPVVAVALFVMRRRN